MGDLTTWRDVSLILLALEAFIIGLPFAVAGYFVVKYLRLGHRWLAAHFPIWQAAAVRARDYVEHYVGYAAMPIITVASLAAAVRSVARLGAAANTQSRRWRYE